MIIKKNEIACKLCGNIIESTHRHDFKWCLCGEVFVDGGLEYLRRGGKNLDNIMELSDYDDDAT
jgi:hypothetical protein